MKQILLLVTLLLMNIQLSANENLAAKMQEMNTSFRVLGELMRSEVVTEGHIEAAVSLQKLTAQAALFFPDSAVEDSSKLQFTTLMIELINAAIDLEIEAKVILDGQSTDMSKIREIIIEMSGLRRSGHRFFRTR